MLSVGHGVYGLEFKAFKSGLRVSRPEKRAAAECHYGY